MKRTFRYIILLIVIAIVVFVAARQSRRLKHAEKIVAVVNGEPITYSDLKREITFSSLAGLLNSTNLTEVEKKKIEKNVLEDLIIHKILLQEARKKAVTVSDTEVKNYIASIVEGLSQGYEFQVKVGDTKTLSQIENELYQIGLSQGKNINLEKGQFYRMGNRLYFYPVQLKNAYVIFVPDTTVSEIVELTSTGFRKHDSVIVRLAPPLQTMLQKAGLDYKTWEERIREDLIIDKLIKQEVYSKITVTRAELKKEYNLNKDKYYQPEKYEIRQIFIQRSYNDAEDKKQRALAQRIRRILLQRKSSFSTLAKKYSQSPEAEKGGYLGYVKLSQLPVEFSLYLPKMRKYQISKIIETPFGYHIVQLLDKVPAYNKPLKEVKDEIEEKIKKQKVESAFSTWLEKLEKESVITVYYNYFDEGQDE